jgi:Rod binding domain-containing protein
MAAPIGSATVAPASTGPSGTPRPKNIVEAAKQFEALLIGQMLKAAHGDDSDGWLGSGDDPGSSTAMEMAEGQFAQALAQSGGLGLSARIASSLSQPAQTAASSEASTPHALLRGVRH